MYVQAKMKSLNTFSNSVSWINLMFAMKAYSNVLLDWLANKSMNENLFLMFIIYVDKEWIYSSVTCIWSSSYEVCCTSNMDSGLWYWPLEIFLNILTCMYLSQYHDWHILEHITDIIMITLHTQTKKLLYQQWDMKMLERPPHHKLFPKLLLKFS